ncbi:MAG: CD225/dispanin family protein [Kineosporiaceae bacterium]|nr:CD225/dispanin family protein [Kineosporiaceae bacterium]
MPPQFGTPTRQGAGLYGRPGQGAATRPENYLVWAILTTVLCCLPAGIVSIVQAAKVNDLYDAGRHTEAMVAAQSAKKWAVISALSTIVVIGLSIVVSAAIPVFLAQRPGGLAP